MFLLLCLRLEDWRTEATRWATMVGWGDLLHHLPASLYHQAMADLHPEVVRLQKPPYSYIALITMAINSRLHL